MAAQGVDEVMAFLTAHGFDSAASALREDVLSRGGAAADEELPPLPPLRLEAPIRRADDASAAAAAAAAAPSSASSSGSSDAFVSMRSTPSGLLNPYGLWSPVRAKSEASSSSEIEFGTARDYDNFFNESWWYDDQPHDPFHVNASSDDGFCSEDKFVMSIEAEKKFGIQGIGGLGGNEDSHEHVSDTGCEGCAENYSCSYPLCGCCSDGSKKARDPSSTVYGRYQIMDDHTETLDECGDDFGFQLKQVGAHEKDVVLEGKALHDVNQGDEKEFQMLNSFPHDVGALANADTTHDRKSNGKLIDYNVDNDDEELRKEGYNIQPFPEEGDADDAYQLEDYGPINGDSQDLGATQIEEEDSETNVYLALRNFQKEYEIFDLRIIHRKNRTGFEENKDFPVVLNSVVAGRYYITEYLGSAAFSKVVQAHDLQMGMDICLKIIKNDKDFFDQSLDEIKLLKFVNKYDPADEHHILRLYDYFYYHAIARQCLEALVYLHHLRIIHCDLKPENILIKSYSRCEIKVIDLGSSCFLLDNLSSYVQSRSYRAPEVILGLPYDQKIDIWSLGCILAELYTGDVLFPNEPVVMMLARMIGIIGPIDMEMLVLGQETPKYFTDDYDLYHKNEVTDQIEFLIPKKSSLESHLQASDTKFIDFLSYLLQINPRRRPTASEALQHQWLSFSYR
ncbi:uncharacterized protein LOC109728290 isoform X2 [Ananas comosus]|uniref:Uncharacterized protein LOC109728290 isoform X2 n=1 Tax=Ananas comosus TaxID=4615 RepID=A0A6P5H2D9_ANACO|nr:uncharacterized protein LOC109728290 isoform X2 [Ananas comosus]